jgi:integrase
MLGILLNTAVIEGYVESNIVHEITLTRRKKSGYVITPWDDADVLAMFEKAKEMEYSSIARAVVIAYEEGQRKTDVLNMKIPDDYHNGKFIYWQSKTGKAVWIPATSWALDELGGLGDGLICACEGTGKKWTDTNFSHRFREIADAAGLPGYIFKQLRHSHLINLERAGCSDKERNSHSGHSRTSGNALMDKSYGLQRDAKLATAAVEKYERFRKEHGFMKEAESDTSLM